ncbi:TPA: hypothetical protein ACN359_004548 [Vibrio parahaemolyticus]|nr:MULTISPECIES: hypothetical protein [Vibrio]EJG0923866.1 hypothetical protein [Vibrio parahaemolyticus O1:K68]EJG0933526.1 hypothetical protein [Vibrio parahaemolyticus O1]EJG0947717.1 hypothetical protein [Vibrio parahaemolyticus O10]EQM49678.1 hypothetical protein D051_4126 [Vibrio parahaemolyticus VPCR-2010]EGQ9065204.1 hypothetical protein [Vibrio parahaemolyticus]
MPELGVSEFSTIVVASGKPKQTKIRSLSKRGPYAFYKDYYLPLRTAIKHLFTKKRHISYLYEVCRKQKDSRKKVNYELVANHFRDWQSGKNITAFTPPRDYYNYSRTSINCNPELHVVLHGQPRLVKLHFSGSDKMTQERANIICALTEEAIGDHEFEYSVLDLTTGKEFFFNGDYEKTFIRINKEIKNLEEFWEEAA